MRLCGRRLAPPPLSHVVGFPRLEVPLSGDYENEGEFEGESRFVSIKPGCALFAPRHCWNRPTWRKSVRVLSVLFGHRHLGFSLVTSAGSARGAMTAEKFSIAQHMGGAMVRITEALSDLNDGQSPPEALPGLVRSLRMYRRRPFQLVTVAVNYADEEKAVQTFLETQRASARNLMPASMDPSEIVQALDKDWNGGVAYTMVIAPGGKVLYRSS